MSRVNEASRFAEIVLPIPVDRPFTYAVPKAMVGRISVGMRAVVHVQRRVVTGYVVGLLSSTDVASPKPIIDLPDTLPAFQPDMIELCRWIADYYCCSLGEALQCAVPAGINVRAKMRYTLVLENIATGRFSERQRKIIAELHRRGPLTEGQLVKAVGQGALSNTLQALVKRDILIAEPVLTSAGVNMKTETYVRLVEDGLLSNEEISALQRRAPRQAAVYLDLVHEECERPAADLYEQHKANSGIIRALVKKGLVERIEKELYRGPDIEADPNAGEKLKLNSEQQSAYDAITAQVDAEQFQTFLLHGITGSGKTEVYLQASEHALAKGRDAIILVPEISLTPQTVGRFKARFKEDIAVLHSGLSAGERYDEWRRAQRGEVRIVVGARSAIFAPLRNVGIVIVDEEHDTSYKQGEVPRYHGRDVAIMRAKLNRGVCVLGSATPSIESYHNSETGKSRRLELLHRATNAKLPKVEIVDMRKETKEAGGAIILSRRLEREVNARVAAGGQVILFLNRRGFSPFVLCPQCGWVAECTDCQVSLTYHASGAFLSCHYCNARRDVPQSCDKCKFHPLVYLGVGTQKVEDLLMRSFPGASVARMDADTTAGRGGHAKILGRFASGDIDILIGTQMIAKGHDYPGVTLVGVINADTGLSVPDFRAAENTFQLLTQVAGRAGRGERPGRVIIQTFRPKHYAVLAAAQHDYPAFFEREITERYNSAYPPYRRMANFAIESEDPLLAEKSIALLHRIVREQIQTLDFKGVETLGPSPASIKRVKKKYRWNLAILSKSPKRLNAIARATRSDFAQRSATSRVQLKVDLDPYGMF